jgi:integrase
MARHGRGIIKRSDGRWMARATIDGKRKSYYGETAKEAEDARLEALMLAKQGITDLNERQTVGQYLATWHETMQPRLAPTSHVRYGDYIKHLTNGLGSIPLTKLTAQQVQLFETRKVNDGVLSNRYIQLMHTMFKQSLNDALILGLIPRNVCAAVKPPKAERKKMHPMDFEQARRFLQVIQDDRLEAMYVLAITTGMRLGELLALSWDDVDLTRRVVVVQQNMQRVRGLKGGFRPNQPKTAHSRRTIGLTDVAIESLARHWKQQQAERSAGMPYNEQLNLVFCTRNGGHYHNPRIIADKWYKDFLTRAGLSLVHRFHDLRHTCATLLLAAGVNVKVVSEMLGHSSVTITLNIYAHVLPHMQQSAVDAMSNLLGSSEPRKIATIPGPLVS